MGRAFSEVFVVIQENKRNTYLRSSIKHHVLLLLLLYPTSNDFFALLFFFVFKNSAQIQRRALCSLCIFIRFYFPEDFTRTLKRARA